MGVLKFNVDGAASSKPGPARIGGVLRNHIGELLYMFSKNVGIKDSYEAEILAILEALRNYHCPFQYPPVVESDSMNAVYWARSFRGPWKMQFYFNEIKTRMMGNSISFQHISRSTNGTAYSLAKQGVDRLCDLSAMTVLFFGFGFGWLGIYLSYRPPFFPL